MPSSSNAQESLCKEILTDAERKRDEIVSKARKSAARLLTEAEADAARERATVLAAATREATRSRDVILAAVPAETARAYSARLETLLTSIRREIEDGLRNCQGPEADRILLSLALEATKEMEGPELILEIPATAGCAIEALLKEKIAQQRTPSAVYVTVIRTQEIAEAGPIVHGAKGRQILDNRPSTRMKRIWPELRRQIAEQIIDETRSRLNEGLK